MKKEKIVYLEMLRIIAIIGVVFNHTGGIEAFVMVPLQSKRFILYTTLSLFCKIGVPVFFMVSGVLLLGKTRNNIRWLVKKIIKFVIILILVTLIFVFYKRIRHGEVHGLKDFIIYLYEGKGLSAHLWFLYAYIAFLIALPIMDALISNISKNVFIYLVVIYSFFKVITAFQFIVLNDQFLLRADVMPGWIMNDIFIYPIMGYCINKYDGCFEKKTVLSFILYALIILFFNVFIIYNMALRNGGNFDGLSVQMWHSHFAMIFSMAVFVSVKRLSVFVPVKLNTLIIKGGEATFGVYVIHIMIKDLKPMLKWFEKMSKSMDYILACILYVLVVWFISTVLVVVINAFKETLIKNLCKRRCNSAF